MTDKHDKSVPFLIIRLWPHHHTDEVDLGELLAALKANRRACDEVWFCTEIGFPPMEEHDRSARMMAEAAAKVRALGIAAGLQIANTLGHGGLSLLQDDSGAVWPFMVDADGRESPPIACPRAPDARTYIDRMTRTYAAWQPSSIWIDDDLRMSSHGSLQHGCFCPECVREFSTKQRRKFTRRSLVTALHHPSGGAVRLAWTKFNGESLAGIARIVAQAAHAAAPACRFGFQQLGHERFMYSGPDWKPILRSLARVSRYPSRARLGHGYYTDHNPRQMINKALLISRQVSRLPGCVDQVCPEIESHTHNAFGKSAHGLVVESALDLAMGCNSLSYAVLGSGHEPMRWYETLLSRIASCRPFWEEYVRINAGTTPGGLEVRLGIEHVARAVQSKEAPFAWASVDLDGIHHLACLGLPLCTSAQGASAVILHGDAVAGLKDSELRRILSGGVMMDGLAAIRVQERGFGKWLGVEVKPIARPAPFRERISDDTCNGVYAGKRWNASINASGLFMLNPFSTRVRVLGHYEDRLNVTRGVATALSENGSGGRVAVFGYYGWESAPSGARRNQYLAAADWVTRGKLPVVVQSIAQVMVVPRVDFTGRLATVFLLNASIDATPPLELRLRGVGGRTVHWRTPDGRRRDLVLTGQGEGKRCRTPSLAGWSVACLIMPPYKGGAGGKSWPA